jgi:succinoglycan biosynthesis protein ExoM
MSTHKRPHVAICIATYRRPAGLRKLLASLNVLAFRADVPRITVVVVDNDANSTLTLDDLAVAHPLIYRIEARRGLAAVRNACLDHAPADADFAVFIDDDEWAEPEWLDALLTMQTKSGASIVQGVVRPAYPQTPPAWMSHGRYHEVGPFLDGENLTHGASGNVLIDRHTLAASGVRFHEDFDQAGGEDVDFFHALQIQGHRIVAAAGAVANEDVPRDRMTLAWVLRRRFRTGHTLGQIARRQGGISGRVAKAIARVGAGAAESTLGLLVSRTRTIHGLTNIAWGLGTLAAVSHLPVISDRKP